MKTNLVLFTILFTFGLSTYADNKLRDKKVAKDTATVTAIPEGFIYSFLGNPKYWKTVEPEEVQVTEALSEGEAPVRETNDIPKLAPPEKVFDAIRLRVYKSKTGQNYIAFAYCKNAITDYQNKNCTGIGKREAYWIFDIIEALKMTGDERAVIYGAKLFNTKFSRYLKTTMMEDLLAGTPKKYMLPFAKDMVAMNAFIEHITSAIDASHAALLPGR